MARISTTVLPNDTKRLSLIAGALHLAFGASLHALHTNGPIVPGATLVAQNTFGAVLWVLAIGTNFALGFGVVWLYRERGLVLPGALLVGFGLWSVGVTISEWPLVVLRGYEGFNPFSLRPVPYLWKFVPFAVLTLGGATLESGLRRGRRVWRERRSVSDP